LITTPQTRSLPSNLTLHQFAEAMKALDLAKIPREHRNAALMDHLARIMASTIHDRARAQELAGALLARARTRNA
jgi:hypothetical protein